MLKLMKIMNRVIISSFLLYGYNLIVKPLNLMIPINLYTIGLVSFLGVPAMFALILVLIYIY